MTRTGYLTLRDLRFTSTLIFCFILLLMPSACSRVDPDIPATGNFVSDCIATPDEWVAHWDKGEWNCVAPSLFATVFFPAGSAQLEDNYLYPCHDENNPCGNGFRYAWAFSNTNLELALALNRRYRDDPGKVSSALFSLVGFTGVETFDASTQVYLALFTLPESERPLVPSWETWFRLLDDLAAATEALQEFYNDQDTQARLLAAQQSLVHQYSRIGDSDLEERHQDVVAVYSQLSGCPRATMLATPTEQGTGTDTDYLAQGVAPPDLARHCSESTSVCWDKFDSGCSGDNYSHYKKFMLEADLLSPYAGADSQQCFINAMTYFRNNPEMILATTLRAMLAQCQDANMLNTGTGLGYNTYPNPKSYRADCRGYWDPVSRNREQSVLERLTGREFIVTNRKLKDLPAYAYVPLIFAAKSSPRPYLVNGYCD